LPEFCADLSRYKKCELNVPITKTCSLFAAILRPFAQGTKILTQDLISANICL